VRNMGVDFEKPGRAATGVSAAPAVQCWSQRVSPLVPRGEGAVGHANAPGAFWGLARAKNNKKKWSTGRLMGGYHGRFSLCCLMVTWRQHERAVELSGVPSMCGLPAEYWEGVAGSY
jgi:hypothetical protein